MVGNATNNLKIPTSSYSRLGDTKIYFEYVIDRRKFSRSDNIPKICSMTISPIRSLLLNRIRPVTPSISRFLMIFNNSILQHDCCQIESIEKLVEQFFFDKDFSNFSNADVNVNRASNS